MKVNEQDAKKRKDDFLTNHTRSIHIFIYFRSIHNNSPQ